MVISNDLSDHFSYFKVYSNDLTSDHLPIKANFSLAIAVDKPDQKVERIKRINWKKFKSLVDEEIGKEEKLFELLYGETQDGSLDIESTTDCLNDVLKKAEERSTNFTTRKPGLKTLPKYLVDIIKERKKLQNNYQKLKIKGIMDAEIKKILNTLTKLIRKEIQAIQENSWLQFCKKI